MPFDSRRRTFLAQMTGLASLSGVVAGGRTVVAQRAGRSDQTPARSEKWDTAWLDGFKGKHKQLYDLMWHTLRPNTLNPPTFYLDVHRDARSVAAARSLRAVDVALDVLPQRLDREVEIGRASCRERV